MFVRKVYSGFERKYMWFEHKTRLRDRNRFVLLKSREMAFSNNNSDSDHEHVGIIETHNQGFKIGIILCLSVASVVGFLGNGLVIAVIMRAKKLKSVMNRFILHLAISDMVVSVLAIPLFLFVNFNDKMVNDTTSLAVCKIARFFQYLSPEASMTLLITIGWNRHQAVVHPLNIMTYGTANKLILAAWVYALTVVAPSLYLTKLAQTAVDPVTNESLTYCATIPATTLPNTIYVYFLALFGYLIPLVSLIVLYGKIYKTVWRRKSGQLGDSRPEEAFIRSRKKVLKMFLTVIIVFLVTWLPLLLYISFIESAVNSSSSHVDYTRLITYSLGLCNSVCNPFIYALFNKKFRAGCKDMCRVSFKAFQRKKSPVEATNGGTEERQMRVFARRGGFHGTKGNSKANSGKATNDKKANKPEKKESASFPVSQLIGRRFRRLSLRRVEDLDKNSNDAVRLVSYQRTVDPEEVMLHIPGWNISPQTVKSSVSLNTENCVKFADSADENDSDKSDTPPENRKFTAEYGRSAPENKSGYSILIDDVQTPIAERRTRTRSEGSAPRRTKHLRLRSLPASTWLNRDVIVKSQNCSSPKRKRGATTWIFLVWRLQQSTCSPNEDNQIY